MTLPTAARRALAVVAVLLLLVVGWLGLNGGIGQWTDQVTPAQRVQLATQVGYGVGALLVVTTAFWRRRWLRFAETCFSIACAAAASLATVVWGEQSILSGVFSGLGALLIALALTWMLRTGIRS